MIGMVSASNTKETNKNNNHLNTMRHDMEWLLVPWSMFGTMGLLGVICIDLGIDYCHDSDIIMKYYKIQTDTENGGLEKLLIPLLILCSFIPILGRLFFWDLFSFLQLKPTKLISGRNIWIIACSVLGVLEAIYFIQYLKPMETNLYKIGVEENNMELASKYMDTIRISHLVMFGMKLFSLYLLHLGRKSDCDFLFKQLKIEK